MILLFILISLFCGFIPYNNHDAIFSLIITLGIPILFFALKDYSFENVIIKDRLKKIFNFNFFISNILIFLIYFILKKDNGFINLFLREYILTTNLIFFTFLWANSVSSIISRSSWVLSLSSSGKKTERY